MRWYKHDWSTSRRRPRDLTAPRQSTGKCRAIRSGAIESVSDARESRIDERNCDPEEELFTHGRGYRPRRRRAAETAGVPPAKPCYAAVGSRSLTRRESAAAALTIAGGDRNDELGPSTVIAPVTRSRPRVACGIPGREHRRAIIPATSTRQRRSTGALRARSRETVVMDRPATIVRQKLRRPVSATHSNRRTLSSAPTPALRAERGTTTMCRVLLRFEPGPVFTGKACPV